MIKATLSLVFIASMMMGCMSTSTSMDYQNSSSMLQQTDVQSDPNHQNYTNNADQNRSAPYTEFTRYPLLDL